MGRVAIGKVFTDQILPDDQTDGKPIQKFRDANFAAFDGVTGEDVEPAAARQRDTRTAPIPAEPAGPLQSVEVRAGNAEGDREARRHGDSATAAAERDRMGGA